jgi:MFS family permease
MSQMKPPSAPQVTPETAASARDSTGITTEPISLYHWLVVLLAASGWLFDCMGQRIFVLSREPALRELLGSAATDNDVRGWGVVATFLLMIGWATGGIIFGLLSDRCGRVKTMVATLLAFSVFSGLSGFARSGAEFLIYRFIFGLGVGGMFGAATTLVAESVPRRFRTLALGSLQAFSACGNMLASALSLKITPGAESYWGHYSGWQVLSFVSIFPALMAIPMVLILKEPEAWKRAKALASESKGARSVGSLGDLFVHPRWRKHLVVGVCLGVAGMVGLWGIAFFSPELITTAFKDRPLLVSELLRPGEICSALASDANPAVLSLKRHLSPEYAGKLAQLRDTKTVPPDVVKELVSNLNEMMQGGNLYDAAAFQSVKLKKGTKNLIQVVERKPDSKSFYFLNRQLVEQVFPGAILELQTTIDTTRSAGTFLQDLGALFGMFAFTLAAGYFSRRAAFMGAFTMCLVVVAYVFYSLKTASDVYWMLPLMGFATLSVFAGYSIYFPEIFPTRLRGTGVGFCYNTVRYLAAPFPLLLGWLSSLIPFRTVAVMMCGIYLVGILALAWAPETKGQPLPEDG